jgi:XRE family transcriptional regulator, regulator of sulfur utilization
VAKATRVKAARPRVGAAKAEHVGASELALRVAASLRGFRSGRDLSLDELAAKSGVSRAALSQIESGRTNPTLGVLWKIAVGLELPFHDLLGADEQESAHLLRSNDSLPLKSADGRIETRLISPGKSSPDLELYEIRLQPKAILRSEPHAARTSETLVVLVGSLRLQVGSSTYELGSGDSAFFRADVPHAYENPSGRETRCVNLIHYTR